MVFRSAAVILVASMLPSMPHAPAAAPTCDGLPATIVGTAGATVTGTAGPDVIVTGGAHMVYARSGDDTICVTGDAPQTEPLIVAGAGSDTVDTTKVAYRVDTSLGNGYQLRGEPHPSPSDVDTLLGGPGRDLITDPGQETVHITSGGGADSVKMGAGSPDDSIDLGPGPDRVFASGLSTSSAVGLPEIDGGSGVNAITFDGQGPMGGPAPNWVIDNRPSRGGVYADGTPELLWKHFSVFDPIMSWSRDVLFRGGPGAEKVRVDGEAAGTGASYTASMGAGNDDVVVGATGYAVTIDGGSGADTVTADPHNYFRTSAHIHLNLTDGTLNLRANDPSAHLDSVENASVVDIVGTPGYSRDNIPIVVIGSPRADQISVTGGGCSIRIDGRAGDDQILTRGTQVCPHTTFRRLSGGDGDDFVVGSFGSDHIDGGAGNDRLLGHANNDRLTGGPGRDQAIGGNGYDRCQAETAQNCEKR